MFLTVLALLPLAIWIFLLCWRGGFWRVSRHFAPEGLPQVPHTRIAAVIPARNEADGIRAALRSLFEQEFRGELRLFVVDDNSTDGTAQVARQAAEQSGRADMLTVVNGAPLVAGWTGKLWAVQQGIACAGLFLPDYYLLTDADVVHSPHDVAELVGIAEARGCDLASYMVKLACDSVAEKVLIPAFVFFFFLVYPPGKVAGAAGGCILVKRTALERIGGIAAIRQEVIDDCALARAVDRDGGKIWLGLTPETRSTRSYGTFAEIGRMISRTAFNQLHHSAVLLAATVVGLLLTYLLPVMLVLSGRPALMVLGGLSWALMTVAYFPMVRFYQRPAVWALALPLVACFYMGATLHSAVQYWRGRGGEWKGRVQDVRR